MPSKDNGHCLKSSRAHSPELSHARDDLLALCPGACVFFSYYFQSRTRKDLGSEL